MFFCIIWIVKVTISEKSMKMFMSHADGVKKRDKFIGTATVVQCVVVFFWGGCVESERSFLYFWSFPFCLVFTVQLD